MSMVAMIEECPRWRLIASGCAPLLINNATDVCRRSCARSVGGSPAVRTVGLHTFPVDTTRSGGRVFPGLGGVGILALVVPETRKEGHTCRTIIGSSEMSGVW